MARWYLPIVPRLGSAVREISSLFMTYMFFPVHTRRATMGGGGGGGREAGSSRLGPLFFLVNHIRFLCPFTEKSSSFPVRVR